MYLFPILVGIIIIVSSVWYTRTSISVKSTIDGRSYRVKNNVLSQDSADLLAVMNSRLSTLVDNIRSVNPPLKIYKNLKRFNPDNTHENIFNLDTAYTIDKGRSMLFCVGPRNEQTPRLYDINTMMYVAIHELAHVASDSIGHNEEFKINFTDLLLRSIDLGLYKYVDYSKYPTNYCGLELTRNIIGY